MIRLLVCIAIAWIFAAPSQSQSNDALDQKIAAISVVDLPAVLSAAKLFHSLESAQYTFNQTRFCGQYLDIADETAAELEQLNLVRNKTSESYGRRAAEVKRANTEAIRDYETCFDNLLPGFAAIEKAEIYTYSSFGARYDEMVGNYEDVADLDAYILKLEAAIKAAAEAQDPCSSNNRAVVKRIGTAPTDIVGTIRNTHKVVEVLPLGRGNRWKRVCSGYQLRLKDEVRTGARGRARIQLTERYDGDVNVINMGSDTHILIEKFASSADPKDKTLLQMLRGNLRALTSGFGQHFQVRTGATICGIRGTEVAISYDPDTNVADYILDHGDAYYQLANGPEVSLQARTGVRISQGQVSAPRMISDSDWQGQVQATALPFGVEPGLNSTGASAGSIEPPPPSIEEIRAVFAKDQRLRAKNLARTYLDGLMTANRNMIDRVLAGAAKTYFDQQIGSQSLRSALQTSGGQPISYELQCALCDASEACHVSAFVRTAKSPPGQGANLVFSIERTGSGNEQRIVRMSGAAEDVEAFQKRAPVCSEE